MSTVNCKMHSAPENGNSSLAVFVEVPSKEPPPAQERTQPLEDSCTLVQSRLSLEYIVCTSYMLGLLYYMFHVVSEASRMHSPGLGVEAPRWKVLKQAPFYSIGYNGSGDGQWRHLDKWLWLLVIFYMCFAMGSWFIRWAFRGSKESTVLQRYHVVVGLGFVAFLHGPSFFVPLLFALANYVFAVYAVRCRMPYRLFMTVMWVSQIAMIFVNSWYGDHIASKYVLTSEEWWPQRLRWVVVFNMYTLRMIAFNMDLYEAINDGAAQQERAVRKHDTTCVECAQMREAGGGGRSHSTRCYKFRTEHPRRPCEYNLLSYLAYMLYVPLYIAGPMSSFNAFVSHCHHPTVSMSLRQKAFYALRVVVMYSMVTLMLHFVFVNAVRNAIHVLTFSNFFASISMLYLQLAFLWLKFNCVWKLFRLLSLLDGVDVPEDMRRCFTNTVSIQGFWRDWHASFNL
ncbi:glycerol uptake protein, partial [Trypanosoma grayi]|uniref:glycerol uptake protein n=1 Tax=Trypanosoma grayi TaxID=71804 RepID=UPI0004F45B2A